MILRLEIPNTNPSLTGGTIKEWHKSEGDTIAFGDDICTLSFDEFAALRRTARATLLAGRRSKNLKSQLESREGKVLLDVVLNSADSASMGKILLGAGERFAVEDTIAIVVTSDDDDIDSYELSAASPAMRVVPNTSSDPEHV